MNLFHQIIPLKDKSHDRILVIMIALMMCSILMIVSSALFLGNLSAYWHNSVTHIATLELPNNTSKSTLRELKKTLSNNSFVEEYKVINKSKIQEIIAPWVDQKILESKDLPLPIIFTLSLKSGSAIERDKLKFALKALDDKIIMDSHENWLGAAFDRAKKIQTLAWIIGLALTLTLITSLSILTRTRILLNVEAITLLHISGASDLYILKQFLIYIFSLAFKGILIGILCASAILLVLSFSMSSNQSDLFAVTTLTPHNMLVVYVIPIFILLFMLLITSKTVMNALRRMV